MQENIEKVIIIGWGPAGLTAAIYTARANLHPLVFEGFMAEGVAPWGLLTTTGKIENFPGFEEGIFGVALMQKMRTQSINQGARILTETVEKVDFTVYPFKVSTTKQEYFAESVIIATGAKPKKLGIPWEKQFWQRGVSVCAVCDGHSPLFKEKTVVVIWNGDIAAEEALYMSNLASQVKIIFKEDSFHATKVLQERISQKKNIEICPHHEVLALEGEKVLQAIVIKDLSTQKEEKSECNGVFYALWMQPNTTLFENEIEVDEKGYIKISDKGKTSKRGVFAWWEVCDPLYQQAITSASGGCQAAFGVIEFLW